MERSCGNCRNHAEQCASSGQMCGSRLACWYPDSSLTPDSISERAALEIIRRSRSEKKSLRYELDKIQVSERLCYRWLSVPGCPSSYFLREMALAGYDIDYILTGVRNRHWVPVTERLPDLIPCNAGTAYSEAVIVLTSGRKVMEAVFTGDDWMCAAGYWDAEGEEIMHWMPLPSLPEEALG